MSETGNAMRVTETTTSLAEEEYTDGSRGQKKW